MVPRYATVRRHLFGAGCGALVACQGPSPASGDSADPQDWITADRPDVTVLVTADGAPLSGAWVTVSPGGRETQTGDDGAARLPQLEDGTYTVLADAEGYAAAEATVVVAGADASAALDLVADPVGASLSGTVTGPDDLPVDGASVTLDGVEIAVTGADGTYAADGVDPGTYSFAIVPPAPYRTWVSPAVDVPQNADVVVSATIPGGPEDGATYLGSTYCGYCHADDGGWSASGHGRAARGPTSSDLPAGLADAFSAGDTVDLGDEVVGARIVLGTSDTGGWTARVEDAAGATTGDLDVVEIYGGLKFGAALAVEAGGTRVVLPAAWALAGQGLSADQASAAFVPAWTAGWFDVAGGLSLDATGAPGSEASWDLRCAGCHATGAKLEEDGDGHYALARSAGTGAVERVVGCEACHGPGSSHVAHVSTGDQARYIFNPRDLPAWQRPDVCARCHARVDDSTHPLQAAPGWAVDETGAQLDPWDVVADAAGASRQTWLSADASRIHRDQSGDFEASPHRQGTSGYDGACEDCHDPHGGSFAGALLRDDGDNTLCTSCHASRFPDEATEQAHSGHSVHDPGLWTQGSCVGCHFPRTGTAVRADALSGAGEARAHVLTFLEPSVALAEFDAAGTDTLPLGSVPPSACLDCHTQQDAALEEIGDNLVGPTGDATRRSTFEDWQGVFELFRGWSE